MASLSSQYFKSILDILVSMGFDADGHLAAAGVEPSLLDSPKYRISIDTLVDVFNRAAAALDEPNIGLEVGYRFRVATFTDTGSILAHCHTLAEAAQMNEKYQILTESLGDSKFVRRGEQAFLVWNESFEDHETYRHVTELILGGYVLTTNWLAWGFDGGSKRVSFRHKAPQDISRHKEILQCPMIFEADENHLEFDAEFVDRKLPTSNPDKLLQVSQRLDAYMSSYLEQSKFRAEAIKAIHLAIRRNRLSIGEVAEALALSERSLRRSLASEGLKYRDLVESVRQSICKTYMADGRSLTEIAQILGYNDQSAFTRAFKKWYGVSPSEYKLDKFSM